jgi:hypothetical protein
MASKLKQRRMRRLKADVTWWREEAEDCRSRPGTGRGNRQAQKAGYPRADASSHAKGNGPPALLHRNKKMSYLQ